MCKRYAALLAYFLNTRLIKSYYQKNGNFILIMTLKLFTYQAGCRYVPEKQNHYKNITI